MFEKTYVAMDITNADVRVMAVKGNKVKKWTSAPIPEGSVRNGSVLEPAAVGAVIDEIFRSLKLKRNRVICAVTGLPFIYRVISMPRSAPGSLDEAIERAARQEMSLTRENMQLLWRPVEDSANTDEINYLVLGVPRNSLLQLRETLAKAGIRPYIMEVKPLALARASSLKEALIVSLEKGFYDIIVVSGGLIRVMHSVTPAAKKQDSTGIVNELVDGLNKAIKSFNRDFPDNALQPDTRVSLCGELSLDNEILGLAQQVTGHPVSILKPALDFPPGMPSELFASTAGLASGKRKGNNGRSEYHDIDINLFSRVKKPGELRKRLAYAGSGLVLVLLLALVYKSYDFKAGAADRAGSLQERAAGIAQQLSNVQKTNVQLLADKKTSADKVQVLIDQKNAIADEHKKIMEQKRDFAGRITSIVSALPEGAEYESIEMRPGGVTVSGQVADPFDVLSFTGALEWSAFSGARAETIAPLKETGGAKFEVYITE